jgi:hypothetical protein
MAALPATAEAPASFIWSAKITAIPAFGLLLAHYYLPNERITVAFRRPLECRVSRPLENRHNIGTEMTTTVMIAVQGNKEVSIETPTGRMVLPPGKWVHGLQIHGEQSLRISETGGFVDAGPGARFEDVPNLIPAATPG